MLAKRIVAVVGVGALLGLTAPAISADPAQSDEATARSDAHMLLASLPLPSDATQSATEPTGDGGVLANPPYTPATPNLVDDSGWWVASDSPDDVLAYVKAHIPAPAKLTTTVGEGQGGQTAYGFSWPAEDGVLSSRELIVEVVRLNDGSTGIRADSQDVWITPRPASEVIPAGMHQLTVSITGGNAQQQPLMFSSASKIDHVVALINSLPAAQPGVQACPADFGVIVRLAFSGSQSQSAVATVDPYGCEGVGLSLDGAQQPGLTSEAFEGSGRSPSTSLIDQIDAALGVKLDIATPGARPAPQLARFHRGGVSFEHPVAWRVHRYRNDNSTGSTLIAYLSNQRLHSPCRIRHPHHATIATCHRPLSELRRGSILAAWTNNGAKGWSPQRAPGRWIRIGGRPAKLHLNHASCSIGADVELDAVIPISRAPHNWYEFTACIRGPGTAALERQTRALLRSVRFGS